jgi:HEAT repeat protein
MPVTVRVQGWLDALCGSASPRRTKAAELLLNLGEDYFERNRVDAGERDAILEKVAALVADPEAIVRESVAGLAARLRRWSETTRMVLETLLADAEPAVRTTAIWATGELGGEAAPLIPGLLRCAGSPDPEVRLRVPWALAEINHKHAAAARIAVDLTRDAEQTVRTYALRAMSVCGDVADSSLIDVALRGLQDEAPGARCEACAALARLGVARPDVMTALREQLAQARQDTQPGVELEVVLALTTLDPSTAAEPAIRAWLEANRGYWWVPKLLGES